MSILRNIIQYGVIYFAVFDKIFTMKHHQNWQYKTKHNRKLQFSRENQLLFIKIVCFAIYNVKC